VILHVLPLRILLHNIILACLREGSANRLPDVHPAVRRDVHRRGDARVWRRRGAHRSSSRAACSLCGARVLIATLGEHTRCLGTRTTAKEVVRLLRDRLVPLTDAPHQTTPVCKYQRVIGVRTVRRDALCHAVPIEETAATAAVWVARLEPVSETQLMFSLLRIA
jgi:hypothetical protein